MRTSKNSVSLIPLKDFGSSPFLEHGIFIEAFEDCVSVRHKRMEVHRHDYVELFWLDGNGSVLIDFENYPLSGKSLIAIGPGRVHAWQVGVTYCLKHGIETAQPQAPRLQLVNRIQIETPERPLHIRLQRLHEPRFDQKSSLFRFTVCGFELICATSIIGKLLTRNKRKNGRRR